MSSQAYESPVPPERRFTTATCGVLAEQLAVTTARIEQWGLRVPDLGRMRAQRRLLQSVADGGTYPTDPVKLIRIGHAIRDATEFHEIVDWLGETRSKVIASELDRALRGTLDQTERNRKPYQFQSQLWFGAMLELAGLHVVVVPPGISRTADFRVHPGLSSYPVEVKRPASEPGVERALLDARDQLDASGVPGAILFDLSDCLDKDATAIVTYQSQDAPHDLAFPSFMRMRDLIGARVFDPATRQLRPGFNAVMVLMVFARGFRWRLDVPAAPDPFTMSEVGVFTNTKHNLRYYHGRVIGEGIHAAMIRAGMFVKESRTTTLELR